MISQLHREMKQIHSNLFNYSGETKADPSGDSSFLGKYILGAKNNFKDFNNDRRAPPLQEPVRHLDPAETIEEPKEEQKEEQSAEGQTDNTLETGNDDANEIVIDIESSPDAKSRNAADEKLTEETKEGTDPNGDVEESHGDAVEVISEGFKFNLGQTSLVSFLAKRVEEKLEKTVKDNVEELDGGGTDVNEDDEESNAASEDAEVVGEEIKLDLNQTSMVSFLAKRIEEKLGRNFKENMEELIAGRTDACGDVEESSGASEDANEDAEVVIYGIKFDLNQTSLMNFLTKRIEEKLDRTCSFTEKQASSPTNSNISQDTGFGSQEFDPSAGSS